MRTPLLRALAALPVVVLPLQAQLVRGTVKAADGTPLPGAVVTLQAANGLPTARTLVRPNGFFELRAPGEGRFGLVVDRLGFESALLPPVDVRGLVTNVTVVPESRASVPGPSPADAGECRIGLALSGRALDLWAMVRQSYVAQLTAEQSRMPVREVQRYERSWDVEAKKIFEERRLPAARITERSFVTLPPDSLLKVGYVHGDSTYFAFEAPDPRAFLSDAFAVKHCFRELPGEKTVDGRVLVPLAFQPMAPPTVTDVKGTFWLERETGRLAEMEFSYEPQPAKRGVYGGRQTYARTATGVAYLASWSQRLPVFVARASSDQRAVLTQDKQLQKAFSKTLEVASIREDGGVVINLP